MKEIFNCFVKGISLLWILYVSHNIYITAEGYYLQYKFNMDEDETFEYMQKTTLPKSCKVTIKREQNFTQNIQPEKIYKQIVSKKILKEDYHMSAIIGSESESWSFATTTSNDKFHVDFNADYHLTPDNKVVVDECKMILRT